MRVVSLASPEGPKEYAAQVKARQERLAQLREAVRNGFLRCSRLPLSNTQAAEIRASLPATVGVKPDITTVLPKKIATFIDLFLIARSRPKTGSPSVDYESPPLHHPRFLLCRC